MRLMTAQGTYLKLHQVLSICVHYDVILIVKKKNVAFFYWQCVTLLNSTWYEILIENGANVFYTNLSSFKSGEGRWTTSNAANKMACSSMNGFRD